MATQSASFITHTCIDCGDAFLDCAFVMLCDRCAKERLAGKREDTAMWKEAFEAGAEHARETVGDWYQPRPFGR